MKKKYTVVNQYLTNDVCVIEADSYADAVKRSDYETERLRTLDRGIAADMFLVTPCDIRDIGRLADCPDIQQFDAIKKHWSPFKMISQDVELTDLDTWTPQQGESH